MVQYLEELLHSKTKDSQSSILFAQWSYDKRVIPVALQAVSNLFPHYSLHDESHSATIINNIVRILGKDNLNKLSSIDIWLLLEAAYSHDLGMVVSGEKLVAAMQSPAFLQFLSELMSNPKHGLHEFAIKFEIDGKKLKARDSFYNLELSDSIRYILAEFFRWSHADRAREIVNSPLDEIQLASPRGVIPQRITRILGDICASHTKDFSEVMKLPFSEVGIDIEDAHPRFIACMLRIGDLLDLDNNRFSEVMLRTLIKIPIDTLNHKAKHMSIESFRVDREEIKIKANCEDYETASIAQHWFNYLNEEISAQMIRWNQIVPSKELGYLPTIGELRVELKNYDLIDGKHKPQFTVDTDKALSLLQGAGLYDGAYQALRELLQNAIDSSLIRMWLENKDVAKADFSTPLSEYFTTAAKGYGISVFINKGDLDGELRSWTIKLTDRGTGMSKADLRYLMNTGSSFKNYGRINIIKEMPVWMRPSGTFGIGFQSVFMLTDTVLIKTKSFFDEQSQEIELNSPNSKKDGGILLKKVASDHATKPGLSLEINYKIKAIPDSYSVSFKSKASEIVHAFDPFTHESLDVEIGKIVDEIADVASRSYFPITLLLDGELLDLNPKPVPFEFYDSKNSLGITIKYFDDNKQYNLLTFYKNQQVEHKIKDFLFLTFEVNIHKDVASEVLTLDRNKIKEEYYKRLRNDILDSSFRVIMSNFEKFTGDYGKILASMYLNTYNGEGGMPDYDLSKYAQWREFDVQASVDSAVTNIRLGALVDRISVLELICRENRDPNTVLQENYILVDETLTIELVGNWSRHAHTVFLITKVVKEFKGIRQQLKTESQSQRFTVLKYDSDVPLMDLASVTILLKKQAFFGARPMLPCPEDFYALRLKKGSRVPYMGYYWMDHNIRMDFPKMVSPFVFKESDNDDKRYFILSLNDKIYNWVYENRFDETTTREDIVKAYAEFCLKVPLDIINKAPSGTE